MLRTVLRRSWTATRTQEVLNRHYLVADAVVRQKPSGLEITLAKAPGEMWTVYNRYIANPSNIKGDELQLSEQDVEDWLRSKGYDGEAPASIKFVTPDEMADADGGHDRLAMRKMVRALFNVIDTDNDGEISLKEFHDWILGAGLGDEKQELTEAFMSKDDNASYSLNYEQFKFLLRSTVLLKAHGGDAEHFAIHSAICEPIAIEMFKKADKNGSGRINVTELEEMWAAYKLGDTAAAKLAFSNADLDGDGHISGEEFQKMLFAEGVFVDSAKETAEESGGWCSIM
eukprot:gnl/TRDRNA2_/TRDRNA2_144274_c0_seq2.p1 gnl/TRDRNA2_/TRDRNA2_144274_c0~~gnl/TRDRNA2_/TRDRNA2_144274_c0_seq2.p1  ORF type:complete len:286 (-),score=79.44 gnl/TRDRNA2_/TRDRNA2_144274_c0_seq2:132-989(-)